MRIVPFEKFEYSIQLSKEEVVSALNMRADFIGRNPDGTTDCIPIGEINDDTFYLKNRTKRNGLLRFHHVVLEGKILEEHDGTKLFINAKFDNLGLYCYFGLIIGYLIFISVTFTGTPVLFKSVITMLFMFSYTLFLANFSSSLEMSKVCLKRIFAAYRANKAIEPTNNPALRAG